MVTVVAGLEGVAVGLAATEVAVATEVEGVGR
jgi:hypothetical protein